MTVGIHITALGFEQLACAGVTLARPPKRCIETENEPKLSEFSESAGCDFRGCGRLTRHPDRAAGLVPINALATVDRVPCPYCRQSDSAERLADSRCNAGETFRPVAVGAASSRTLQFQRPIKDSQLCRPQPRIVQLQWSCSGGWISRMHSQIKRKFPVQEFKSFVEAARRYINLSKVDL